MRLPAEITGKNLIHPGTDGRLRHRLAHFVVSSDRMILDICFFFFQSASELLPVENIFRLELIWIFQSGRKRSSLSSLCCDANCTQ